MKNIYFLICFISYVSLYSFSPVPIEMEKIIALDDDKFEALCSGSFFEIARTTDRLTKNYYLIGEILRRGNPKHLKIAEKFWLWTREFRQDFFQKSFIPVLKNQKNEELETRVKMERAIVCGLSLFIYRNRQGKVYQLPTLNCLKWNEDFYNIPNEVQDFYDEQHEILAKKYDMVKKEFGWEPKNGAPNPQYFEERSKLSEVNDERIDKYNTEILKKLLSFDQDKVEDVYAFQYLGANLDIYYNDEMIREALLNSTTIIRLYLLSKLPYNITKEFYDIGHHDKTFESMEIYLTHLYLKSIDQIKERYLEAADTIEHEIPLFRKRYEIYTTYIEKVENHADFFIRYRYWAFQKERHYRLVETFYGETQEYVSEYKALKEVYSKQISLLPKLDIKKVDLQKVLEEIFPVRDPSEKNIKIIKDFIVTVPKDQLKKFHDNNFVFKRAMPRFSKNDEEERIQSILNKAIEYYGNARDLSDWK